MNKQIILWSGFVGFSFAFLGIIKKVKDKHKNLQIELLHLQNVPFLFEKALQYQTKNGMDSNFAIFLQNIDQILENILNNSFKKELISECLNNLKLLKCNEDDKKSWLEVLSPYLLKQN